MSLKRRVIFVAFFTDRRGKMNQIRKIVLAGLMIALGIILPFATGQIPQIGSMLLPMHIPVMLCGFICGWKYGLAVGFIVPLLRSMMFSMPPMMTAIVMAFELAAYGVITGLLYKVLPGKKMKVYISLIVAMIVGRVVWGLVSLVIYGLTNAVFTWQIFIGGALLNAIPGIILQLIVVPALVLVIEKNWRNIA
jgi:thiamine transporter ThiT